MHHPTDRIAHTTAFVTPVVEHWLEREIAKWVHSMKDRSDDPSHHERTLLPRSYTSLLEKTNYFFFKNNKIKINKLKKKKRKKKKEKKKEIKSVTQSNFTPI